MDDAFETDGRSIKHYITREKFPHYGKQYGLCDDNMRNWDRDLVTSLRNISYDAF